jgi:NADH-quinone oxidoreductase subunit K
MSVPIEAYLLLSLALLVLGLIGVMRRRNPLMLLLSVELMLNAGNISLIGFSRQWDDPAGQLFALVVMVIAAAMPTGATVFMFAQRYGVARDQVASAVAASTLLAIAGIPIAMLVGSSLK